VEGSPAAALLLQEAPEQSLRRLGVAPALNDFVEPVSILINRPPEPVLLAGDGATTSSKCQMSSWLGALRLRRRA
jgi:hypothetical protein